MTKKEFLMLASILKAAYQREKFLANEEDVKLWYKLLEDIPYDVASTAVLKYTQTKKFPPSPADIREASVSVAMKDVPDSGEAWKVVIKAVHKFGYVDLPGMLNSLDPLTREAAERFGPKDLCDIQEDTKMASRAQFMRIYDQIVKRHQEDAAMSPDTRNAIQMLREKTLAQMDEQLLDERKDMTYGIPEYEGSDDLEG